MAIRTGNQKSVTAGMEERDGVAGRINEPREIPQEEQAADR